MDVWGHNLNVLAALTYILAFAAGASAFCCGKRVSNRNAAGSSRRAAIFMSAAFVMQTLGLVHEGLYVHKCPMGSMADVLTIVSWSLVVMYGIVGTAYRMSLLGLFTSALAATFSVASVFVGTGKEFYDVSTTVLVHAWLSLFSYGAFGIMALVSAMYLIQLYGLKKRRRASFFEMLPSLRELERVNFRLLAASVVVYTAAVAAGVWRYVSAGGEVSGAKLFLATAVWIGYAVVLGLKIPNRLHGRKLAYALIAIFIVAVAVLVPIGAGHSRTTPEARAGEVVR
jgi:HemX protein